MNFLGVNEQPFSYYQKVAKCFVQKPAIFEMVTEMAEAESDNTTLWNIALIVWKYLPTIMENFRACKEYVDRFV